MTLVEPTSPPTIPTHRRRLSLKILTSPFRRTPDASTHDTRADGSSSADACVDEAARASPLERTSTQGSSTGPKKLRRRSLSNVVKLAKPSGTKDERLDEAGARSTTVDWAKRTAGHPLPQRPPSLKVERSTVHGALHVEAARDPSRADQRSSAPAAPLLVELDSLRSGPSTYTPDPPGPARPAVASLPPCTGLPFPSRPKPAAARGPPRSATADVEQEPVASSSSERRPQLSQSSSVSSHSSGDMTVWRFPSPPLRYHSSPDSSISSTPSSSPRRASFSDKQPAAAPRTRREPNLSPTSPHRRPFSSPVDPFSPPPPNTSLAATTRKPITIRPQLGGPRVSASLLAKGILVPAPAHGVQRPRTSTRPASTGRSPVQLGWSTTMSAEWPRPLLLVEGVKGRKGGESCDASRHGRSQSVGVPSSRGRFRSAARGQGGRGEHGEQDTLESDGMGIERRRFEAEADTMFTEARLKSLWAELGL